MTLQVFVEYRQTTMKESERRPPSALEEDHAVLC